MRKRVLRYLLVPLGIGAAGAAVFLFIFMRPLAVEVARPAADVPVKVFGLGADSTIFFIFVMGLWITRKGPQHEQK